MSSVYVLTVVLFAWINCYPARPTTVTTSSWSVQFPKKWSFFTFMSKVKVTKTSDVTRQTWCLASPSGHTKMDATMIRTPPKEMNMTLLTTSWPQYRNVLRNLPRKHENRLTDYMPQIHPLKIKSQQPFVVLTFAQTVRDHLITLCSTHSMPIKQDKQLMRLIVQKKAIRHHKQ